MSQQSRVQRRRVFHVVFHDVWRIKDEGGELLAAKFATKKEAIEDARRRAKAAGVAQVIIHKEDHSIETEHTYGQDPRDIPG